MGKRGPKPRRLTDDQTLNYRGKVVADPFGHGEPQRPKGMRPVARQCWDRLVSELRDAGRLFSVDRDTLVIACENWADFIEAASKIREEGFTVQGSQGQPITNPMVRVQKWSEAMYLKCRDQLNLTQTKRERLPSEIQTGEPQDDLADFKAQSRKLRVVGEE